MRTHVEKGSIISHLMSEKMLSWQRTINSKKEFEKDEYNKETMFKERKYFKSIF